MEILDYVEDRTCKTMAVLRQAYDDLHERSYKFATVLVAGGGAAGVYSLGKIGSTSDVMAWAPLAALSLSWFGTAGCLVWQGATSRELSPGNGPTNLSGYYEARLRETPDPAQALQSTRYAELELQQSRMRSYEAGCVVRAEAIDLAYKIASVCSPLVPLIVAAACLVLG